MNATDADRFDAATYRKLNLDLAELGFTDEQLQEHFLKNGYAEKRVFAPTASTSEYLSMRWLRGSGLEIGAGSAPTPVFGSASVVYADIDGGNRIFGATDVSVQYSIDEVVPEELKGRFDFVILSHVLEHSDVLLAALQHLMDLLKPDGIAYVVVPDRDYLVDKDWMEEFPIEHHADELRSPGIYDADHDRAALVSLLAQPELTNPSGDHQVFDDDSGVTTQDGFAKPDFRELLKNSPADNPYRFAIHKHTYSPQGWIRLFADAQKLLDGAFDILETRYGAERSDCHFVLRKKNQVLEKIGHAPEFPGLTVGISFYKNPQLVDNIEVVLSDLVASEMIEAIILINDSPDDLQLQQRLERLIGDPKVSLIRNQENLGYTKAINQAYRHAKKTGTHLVCINSDVRFTRAVLEEVVAVSRLDNQIGFVFPRADSDPLFGMTGVLGARSEIRKKILPRYQFTPTAVGYFLFITDVVLDRFEGFDELFSPGYEEENDFVLRAGAVGFRAALANHALVQHATSSSFSEKAELLKSKHHRMLLNRHPYFSRIVQDYEKSEEQAIYTILNHVHHVNDLVVDCYGFPPVLNGTTIYARDLINALNSCNERDSRVITVLIRQDVYELMNLHHLTRLRFCHDPQTLKPHFNLLRVAQPFEPEILSRALDKSLCSVNIFFDTIAQDIPSLRSPRTEAVWHDLTHVYRNVAFISDASRRAFRARYPVRGAGLHVIHPSLDIADYGPVSSKDAPALEARVLVVGNKFPHKDIAYTMELVAGTSATNSLSFDVLTDSPLDVSDRVEVYKSGSLAQSEITKLYSSCKFVLYPSYYEGFGLPLMEALHFGRPVIARYSPLYRELQELLGPISQNIHLYKTSKELAKILSNPPEWKDEAPTSPLNWNAVARRVLSVVDNAANAFDFSQRCEARATVGDRNYPVSPPPAQGPGEEMPPPLTPAEQLAIRVERLRSKFPFSFRIARFIYRKLLK
jgi:GT2 family glycosyltransferase/glycosyltransferase involved in cell wall biosynthesis/SAM-dependent methyltransferase